VRPGLNHETTLFGYRRRAAGSVNVDQACGAQRFDLLARDPISRGLLDRDPTDRFGARPTPQAEANAAQNRLLLAREARPGAAIEDGLDGFQGEKLLFVKLSNPAKSAVLFHEGQIRSQL